MSARSESPGYSQRRRAKRRAESPEYSLLLPFAPDAVSLLKNNPSPSLSVTGTSSGLRNVRLSGLDPFRISFAAAFALPTGTPFTSKQTSPTRTPAWAAPPWPATKVTTGRVERARTTEVGTVRKMPEVSSEAWEGGTPERKGRLATNEKSGRSVRTRNHLSHLSHALTL